MKRKLPISMVLTAFLLGIAAVPALGQAPVFNTVTANSTSIQKADKFELSINLTASYTNPYDYSDIAVQCIFTAPGGRKDTVDGFYMQDYALNTGNGNITPSGSGLFRVRYAPNETGSWTYLLSCTSLAGTTTQPAQTFTCVTASNHGFVRKNTSNYLGFDDGTQFIPIGQNMSWQNANVYTDYTNWLTKLSDNSGNFIRIWMSSWAFALEWKNGTNGFAGLKQYKQSSGYWLDWLLDYCKQKGVYMMLCLNNHGQVSTTTDAEWINNPYNAANGGPSTNTWDFFTNATARDLHKNRLRYVVARYGYSTSIQSWELFNEVEWTNNFSAHKTEITTWHAEMAAYIKSKDVYKHLVTTSYAQEANDAATWSLPDMDFTQTHYYTSAPNIESILNSGVQSYLTQFGKPTINGEFGLSGSSGAAESTADSTGIHLHNAIWGSAFSGAMGSAMTWWWDTYVHPRNLYYHYKPLSMVLSQIALKNEQYTIHTATTIGGGASDLSISPGSGYGKSPAADFTIDAAGKMTPGPSQLSSYIFGSVFNTQNRNPPTFRITYPVAGQFKVVTSASQGSTAPRVSIYLDGTLLLDVSAAASQTYSINVPSGVHAIKVDNLGTDWVNISSFIFTNAGSPLTTYNLRAAGNKKAAGWILNNLYTWKYLQDNRVAPSAVSGASISIPGISNGSYTVNLYDCSTGMVTSSLNNVQVTAGALNFALPSVGWDMAYTAVENTVLPAAVSTFNGETANGINKLYINIAAAVNVKEVAIEKSKDGNSFYLLENLPAANLSGAHTYVDRDAYFGNNYYRLKITDHDGSIRYSDVVNLKVSAKIKSSVYPNPVKNTLSINFSAVEKGDYRFAIMDVNGQVLTAESHRMPAGDQVISLPFEKYAKGIYLLQIMDSNGKLAATHKITK